MKLSYSAALVALIAASTGALAAGGPLDLSSGSTSFGTTPAAGAFTDLWTFTLAGPSSISGSITSVVNGAQDVDFTSIRIVGATTTPFAQLLSDPFEVWGLGATTLAAGSYTLTLVGTNSAAIGSYAGNLAITAVPEPQTYALLAVGLVGIGVLVRRRHS